MSFFERLECSVPCGAGPFDARQSHHLCTCGMPLVARYDLDAAKKSWMRDSLKTRVPSLMGPWPGMWRYRELMPLFDNEQPVSLGEGWTPMIHAERLGKELGLPHLFIKDESPNPTNSFKARGLSAAVTRAHHLGVKVLSIPTAGNAGNAMSAYAAKAGIAAKVFMPRDVKKPFIRECELYGADVTLVDGLITDAGKMAAELNAKHGWYDVSTLKEPYRIEGKKTMGYEIAEQMDWELPDWIIYPTGGGTGMVGMWKAFAEMAALGWIGTKRPHMVTVQAANCAPIVRAFKEGTEKARPWEGATTIADGLRVPRAIGDFLVLRAVRESDGAAVAVDDSNMVPGMKDLGRFEGISASPESGAALHALRVLQQQGRITAKDRVVVFSTGGALKYLDVLG